jgi:hypothetical protein
MRGCGLTTVALLAILVAGCSKPGASQPATESRTIANSNGAGSKATLEKKQHPLANEQPFPTFPPSDQDRASSSQANVDRGASSPDRQADEDEIDDDASNTHSYAAPRFRPIDDARAAAAGIRKLTGRRLTLYTDVPQSPAVDELPQVFDAAFPQWCDLLGIDAAKYDPWQMRGFLMTDRARFEAVGLCPPEIRQFLNGYTRGHEFWWYNQASDYYRRHLMLHEGTHGVMFTLQKSGRTAWYMEGVAELLATHRWHEGKLTLAYFPRSPDEVSKLGRIETIQRDIQNETGLSLREVLDLKNAAFSKVEPYAWTWATAAFLYEHPRYRDRFGQLMRLRAGDDLNEKLRQAYADDSRSLAIEWQVFIADLAHGYDFDRTKLDLTDGKPIAAGQSVNVTIAADRGWQNTGVLVEAGKRYKLTASGHYQLATAPKPWISEPNGVTIRYHRGLPLGTLVAVINSESPDGGSSLVKPDVIGTGTTLVPKAAGTLFLKINDSPGELNDNAGSAAVVISFEGSLSP